MHLRLSALQTWLSRVQLPSPSPFSASLCTLPQITIFMQLFKLFVCCLSRGIQELYSIWDNQPSMCHCVCVPKPSPKKTPTKPLLHKNGDLQTIVGTSGKREGLQTLCKQLPEPNPSPGESSTAVQRRDRNQPRFNDACRARRLNMSPSKHAQDSLAPVNFAIRPRGKFSPASVTSMGCSHGPRCLQAKEVCCGFPR